MCEFKSESDEEEDTDEEEELHWINNPTPAIMQWFLNPETYHAAAWDHIHSMLSRIFLFFFIKFTGIDLGIQQFINRYLPEVRTPRDQRNEEEQRRDNIRGLHLT